MERTLTATLMFAGIMALSSTAWAGKPIKQAGNFGIGLGTGTTAAPVSLKYFLSDSLSLQGNAGWWRGPVRCSRDYRDRYGNCGFYRSALGLSADILFEGGPLVGNEDVSLDWELGAGAGLGVGDGVGVAIAGVAGLQVNIHAVPIDIVVEYRPNLTLVPGVSFEFIDFTGHIRYYF